LRLESLDIVSRRLRHSSDSYRSYDGVYDAASSRGQRQPSSKEALLEESILSVRCYQIFHDIHDSHLNMFSNRAAWLMAEKAKPSEVKPAPYIHSGESEIVVKNAALRTSCQSLLRKVKILLLLILVSSEKASSMFKPVWTL
jgi:hypothetical protein